VACATATTSSLWQQSLSDPHNRSVSQPAPDRAIKVAITVPWGERLGGAENILWTFLQCHDRKLIDPVVVFFQPGGFEREVAGLGIRTVVIPSGRLRQLGRAVRTVGQVATLLRHERPDVLLNWAAKTQLYGAMAAILAGLSDRVIWWQQMVPHGGWMDRAATALPARAVGCYSDAALRAQERHWPHRPGFVVYPGIAEPALISARELAELRTHLAIPSGRALIGIVGRLQPWKGQDRFLRCLADLCARGHDVHGLVVGGDAGNFSPGFELSLHRLVSELGLEERMTFTGHVAEPGPYFQLMDVSVNASHVEPFGIVVLEAMARGVPVVAFDAGGPAEILQSGQTGLLVPLGDERGLSEALSRLLSSEQLRRDLGVAGRKHFLAHFTAERMTEKLTSELQNRSRLQPGNKGHAS
jgi:glycosyltransferase involved in cell wall biosynthesis